MQNINGLTFWKIGWQHVKFGRILLKHCHMNIARWRGVDLIIDLKEKKQASVWPHLSYQICMTECWDLVWKQEKVAMSHERSNVPNTLSHIEKEKRIPTLPLLYIGKAAIRSAVEPCGEHTANYSFAFY